MSLLLLKIFRVRPPGVRYLGEPWLSVTNVEIINYDLRKA
jgi:hypothetical protein